MRNRPDDWRTFRSIDDLASSSPKRMFALSPNDALVQIALPLVLILAIITRLMVIGQTLAAQERGPVILEMWKQQLILRLDSVMGTWEEEAQLRAFPEFSRVQWQDSFPNDNRFKNLCQHSQALNQWDTLKLDLYHQALQYQSPTDGKSEASPSNLLDLYDPLASVQPEYPDRIPAEFIITPERRTYALTYVDDRMRQWKQEVENLQWAMVAECAARLPMDPEDHTARASDELMRISTQLTDQGYPLLQSITEEYQRAR